MKVMALAMLLAVMQAMPPVPRQATNSPASTSRKVQHETESQKEPATQPPPPSNTTQGVPHDAPTQPQETNDRQHSVVVRELPPVSVTKDWADWGTWLFAFLLAATSVMQVWLLRRTLRYIRRQTHEMRHQRHEMWRQRGVMSGQLHTMQEQLTQLEAAGKQTETMIEHAADQVSALRQSAGAMQENAISGRIAANATLKAAGAALASAQAQVNAERPWITATIRKTVKNIPVVRNGVTVHNSVNPVSFFDFVLKNNGRTPAEIFAIRARTQVSDKGIDGGLPNEPDYTPSELQHVKLLAPSEDWEPNLDTVNLFIRGYRDSEKEGIETTRLHVIFLGVVLYRDQFRPDIAHETRFCYTYLQGLDEYRPSGPRQYTKYT